MWLFEFQTDQLNQIRKATAARLFCDNGENINQIQPLAFQLPGDFGYLEVLKITTVLFLLLISSFKLVTTTSRFLATTSRFPGWICARGQNKIQSIIIDVIIDNIICGQLNCICGRSRKDSEIVER